MVKFKINNSMLERPMYLVVESVSDSSPITKKYPDGE